MAETWAELGRELTEDRRGIRDYPLVLAECRVRRGYCVPVAGPSAWREEYMGEPTWSARIPAAIARAEGLLRKGTPHEINWEYAVPQTEVALAKALWDWLNDERAVYPFLPGACEDEPHNPTCHACIPLRAFCEKVEGL